MPQNRSYTLEELQRMGAQPSPSPAPSPAPQAPAGGTSYTLEQLQEMGAQPQYDSAIRIPPTASIGPPLTRTQRAIGQLRAMAASPAGQYVAREGPQIAGAALGAAVGAPAGPAGMLVGASAGAMGGEGLRQAVTQLQGVESAAPDRIARAAIEGPLQEAGGALAARVLGAPAGVLRRSGNRQIERVLAPTTREAKTVTERVAPELAERGVLAVSRSHLMERASAARSAAAEALEAGWAKVPADQRLPTQPVLDAIEAAKQKFIVDGNVILPAAVAQMDELAAIVRRFGADVSPESLRQTRQVWSMVVDQAGGYGGKDLAAASQVFAQKQAADAIRRAIAKEFPDIASLNADFSFWASVDDVLQAAALRGVGREWSLTDKALAGGAGLAWAMNNPALALLPAIGAAARTTAWRTLSAASKHRLANAIESGAAGEAAAILGRMMTQQAVRPAVSSVAPLLRQDRPE